ncbi:MAG: glycosyltransferase family 2 protein [Prevotella sp.]|nr:glycosyltransferase family 2 protein [Candidatus Prevotella equi]
MQQPIVSIIMPLYNAEKFVEQAVRSVMSQTFQNWELIVVNDCSTDTSATIVDRLAKEDERIKLLHTDKPSGSPTLPRNIAIENAKGRYIAFLDSDDVWLPEKLEEQLPLFEDEETKVVFSYYKKMENDGTLRSNVIKSPKMIDYSRLLKGNVIGNLTGIYDTKKAGKHFLEPVGHEDYVYWLHILRDGGYAVNTNKVHAVYRLTNNSVSRNKLKVCLWDWHIYRKIEKLSLPYSVYCFCFYAVKGLLKARS